MKKQREIRFRAWDEAGRKMIVQNDYDAYDKHMTWQGAVYEKGRLLPYTLLQFTGIKDRKGKEIYEGDIVRLDSWDPSIYQIAFDRGAFYIANADRHEVGDIKYVEQCEVLGNIYENPELLTPSKRLRDVGLV